MANLADISRAEKLCIAKSIHQNLADRAFSGPPEPGLDIFIKEVGDVAGRLEAHVTGKITADATRTEMLDRLAKADEIVDAWVRRIVRFIDAEARRRMSPTAAPARALLGVAFPKRLDPIDDHVISHNAYCHAAVAVLRSPEHQATIAAMGMPKSWIDDFEASIEASDALADERLKARGDKSAHVGLGREADAIWVDCMARLRHYIHSRAKRGDTAKKIEGARLIDPLVVALKKRDAEAAARATRRERQAAAVASSAAVSSMQLA